MKKLITLISIGIFSVVALLVMAYSLSFGGWKALSVQTGSMRPALNPGNLVLVRSVPTSSLRVGDVITYINPLNSKQTITHRIVQINGTSSGPKAFIVKGDANNSIDTPVIERNVVGKVSYRLPLLGYVTDFLRTPLGLILIIYIPALAVIISEIRRLAEYYRKQQPYVAAGYTPPSKKSFSTLAKNSLLVVVLAGFLFFPVKSAFAAFSSTARLTGNIISTAATPQNPSQNCSSHTTNSVTVTNTSNQTATSGSTSVNNNTSGGNASSGSAANNNSTSTTVTINNSGNPCGQ